MLQGIRDGGQIWSQAFARVLRPRERLSLSTWSDRYRQLAGKAASEPGPWRTDRTPYLREPMDALTDPEVEEVVLWFGTQLGKSETCNNWIGYTIDHNPGPIMLVQPTLDLAKRYSKQRIAALIEATPILRDKVRPARARDSGNTLLEKEFDGGILIITGANSSAGLRSMPARDLLFDEVDAYGLSVDDEGDPISIAEKRQDTFARRKRLKTSTCTVKGESRIEQSYETSDRRKYWVPCPHCGKHQVLRWANLKFTPEDPSDARYCCEHCGTLIDEAHKTDMLAAGEWRPEAPHAKTRGYWLSSLYSPLGWLSWEKIAREFLDAKVATTHGDTTLLQVWTNTRLAETWELKGATVVEGDIQKRAENYPLRSVPRGCLLITAAVDVQGDRLEYMLLGWGSAEECFVVDYGKLYGDPAMDTVWLQLDELFAQPLMNAFGMAMRPRAVAVDSGGHHTQMVYTVTRARQGRHWLAVKGQSQAGKPVLGRPTEVDVNWKGKKVKAGARVWPIGSDTGKSVLYQRLMLTQPGPGYVHTSTELDDDFYKGLTAESLVTRYVKGRPRSEWTLKKGRRNEPLDLWVYGYAAASYLGMQRWKPHDWERLAAQIEPPLFEPAATASPDGPVPASGDDGKAEPPPAADKPADAVPARRMRGKGFASRWKN